MNKRELLANYRKKRKEIEKRLKDFRKIRRKDYLHELFFCLLTPQSNAKKCWQAVVQIKENNIENKEISACLADKTRFHNNKAKYIKQARKDWKKIEQEINKKLQEGEIVELRNWLAENVLGLGLKEASHFLRNIGKSQNSVAILDRHILKNIKSLKVIKNIPNLNKKNYLKIEKKFIVFSKQLNIPIDHLDLLFWSQETGEIFK